MAVTKRGSGYQAEFVVGGKRFRQQFDSEAAAEKWEFETRAALKAGKVLPEGPSKSTGGKDVGTLGEVLRSATKFRWTNHDGCVGQVRNATTFVKWAGEKTSPAEALTTGNVLEFVEHLMDERKVANQTINRYLSAISVLAKQAGVAKPDLPWQKGKKGRLRFFTEEEVALVIQTLTLWGKDRIRDLFIFLVDTGARPYSEATAFRWLDLRGNVVTFELTKNDLPRSIPLTKRALEAVERQRPYTGHLSGPFSDIGKWEVIEVWRNIREHIPGLSDTVVYTTRHTCCSWQIIRGIDIRRVQIWMGHKSIQTTLNYAHLAPNHLLDNLTALEGGAAPRLVVVNGKS
ncbi:tyrosine-type recombinase/integrase [Mesorhizobium sp. M1423]|uniref:tyrosine-type recombinase/integrase n=1 Tax=Mesorhizobium sp. M1423 TaxID=2957101 RepID=UPI0033391401